MTKMLQKSLAIGAVALIASPLLQAGVSKDLAYPSGKLSDPKEIMSHVYYVNHFLGFKNYSIQKSKKTITVIVKRSEGKKPLTETVERY
jgi:hypothetical protein